MIVAFFCLYVVVTYLRENSRPGRRGGAVRVVGGWDRVGAEGGEEVAKFHCATSMKMKCG